MFFFSFFPFLKISLIQKEFFIALAIASMFSQSYPAAILSVLQQPLLSDNNVMFNP